MSIFSDRVKEWRRHTKAKIVQAMGGRCQICGYCKCNDALDLHHIEPTKKEFAFSSITANPKAWATIIEELKKCILLCANCHREYHSGVVTLPIEFQHFDENLITISKKRLSSLCPVCGNSKPKQQKTCSYKCAGRLSWCVPWDTINLSNMLITKSKMEIAEELGVTEAAVRKRMKKLKLQ